MINRIGRIVAAGVACLGAVTVSSCREDDPVTVWVEARGTLVTISDDGCTPTQITLREGETRQLTVQNETDREYELRSDQPNAPDRGLAVPPGTTKATFIADAQDQRLICSDADGNTTTIAVIVTD